MLRKGLDHSILQQNNIWKLASGKGTITLRMTESKKEVRLEVIDFSNTDIKGISKTIFNILKDSFLECNKIIVGGIRFSKDDSSEERILKKFLSNLPCIEENTGWKFS